MKANMIKTIYVEDISTEQIKKLEISLGITIKQLKKEIEKLFKLNYSLDDLALKMKYNEMRYIRLISKDKENKTLFELHFLSGCKVFFGKEKNMGGGPSYLKEINIKFIKNQESNINLYNPYKKKKKNYMAY